MITAEELVKITRETREDRLEELLSKMKTHAQAGKSSYSVKSLDNYTRTKLEECGFIIREALIPDMKFMICWWETV